jgi:hypothetical protein
MTPEIVSLLQTGPDAEFWRMAAEQFPEERDLLVAFVRVFRDRYADYTIIDSRRQEFQIKGVALALQLGLVYYDEQTSKLRSDKQYTALCYRMTTLGKRVFLAPDAPNEYVT